MTILGFSPRFWAALCILAAVGAVLWLNALGKRSPLGSPFHRLVGAFAGFSLLAATVFVLLRGERYFAWSNAILLAIPFLIMAGAGLMVIYRMLFAGGEVAQRDLEQMVKVLRRS